MEGDYPNNFEAFLLEKNLHLSLVKYLGTLYTWKFNFV